MRDPQNHGFQYFNGLRLDDLGHPLEGNLHIVNLKNGWPKLKVGHAILVNRPAYNYQQKSKTIFVATKWHLPNGIYLRFSSQRLKKGCRLPHVEAAAADKNSLMQHPRVHGAIVGQAFFQGQTFRDHLSTLSTVFSHFHQATLGSVYLE